MRLITAGGGGGGGGCQDGPDTPGAAGGQAGQITTGGESGDGGGGGPGTETTGGGGAGVPDCQGSGGRFGAGGAGGPPNCVGPGAGGGGGGGGVFGGGGGGGSSAGGGGGGGSSGFGAGATNVSIATDSTGEPAITLVFTAPGGGPPKPKKPTLSGLGLTNSTFVAGKASTPVAGATAVVHHKVGTTFSFRLDRAATVKLSIDKLSPGRRVNGVCRAPTAKLRHKPRCTRTTVIVVLSRLAHKGANKVAFTGRIRGKALAPANYRAVFVPVTEAGASAPKTVNFTIAKH